MPASASFLYDYLVEAEDQEAYIEDNIERPRPSHGNPDDFGITQREASLSRIRYLRQQLEEAEVRVAALKKVWLEEVDARWLIEEYLSTVMDEANKIRAQIKFQQDLASGKEIKIEVFDKDALKKVKIDQFVTNQNNKRRTSNGTLYCCEFHNDSNPSMYVYNDNHYHCYTCEANGDVIKFIMDKEKMTFAQACKYLKAFI